MVNAFFSSRQTLGSKLFSSQAGQEKEEQVKRCFRLTRSTDFRRVRRSGKSYAHPFIVLYVIAAEEDGIRVGVAAGRTVGMAVQRNRAKRLLRAAMSSILPQVLPGYDLLLIARSPLAEATLEQTRQSLLTLLRRAALLVSHDG